MLHTPDSISKYNVPNTLNVLHLNCCSLEAKFADIEMFLLTLVNPSSVLVLKKSWVTQYSKFPTMLDYGRLHSPRTGYARGGGITYWIKKSLSYRQIMPLIKPTAFEASCIFIETEHVLITSIYRPPSSSLDIFYSELEAY